MEANYSYYKVETIDIWEYERSQFLTGQISTELATRIISNIQSIIIDHAKPVFRANDFDNGDGSFHKYYERKVNQFIQACKDIEELYAIDFFFSRNDCYEYNYNIVIDSTQEDFEFWFALKLRQYNDKIIKLDDFLNYQLEKSFDNNFKSFSKFLHLTLRQYKNEFLESNVIETAQEWIDSYSPKETLKDQKEKKPPIASNKEERKMEGDLHSFWLKALQENPQYFQETINTFTDVFAQLKKERFIHANNSLEDFKSIFRNKDISPNKRIIWIGSVKELQWFVKYLMYESKKIADLKNDIWLITSKCFMKKDNNSYTDSQLRNASGKRLQRKVLVESILSKL